MYKSLITIGTGVARDGDVFVMSAVVNAPVVVRTVYNVGLRAGALNVVQPYLTGARTVLLTNKLSTVSVCNSAFNAKVRYGKMKRKTLSGDIIGAARSFAAGIPSSA